MNDHQAPLLEKTAKIVGIKEYILFKLFGEFVMDESIASATGLMNIHTRAWDEDIVAYAGISLDQLPKLVSTSYTFYREEIPYIIGASDGVLSNLGVGAIDEGEVALTIGTSAAIRSASSAPRVDAKGRTFCYLLTDDLWIIGGPINNGGIALQWVVEELIKDDTMTSENATVAALSLAERVPAGSNGLLFLPFLTGERAPLWNPEATASYIGLTRTHTREDMIRAALEGVTFNIYSVLLALQELIGVPNAIYASGGFSRSETWKQMAADIFDQPLHFSPSYESSAFGAVILSMYTLGTLSSSLILKIEKLKKRRLFQMQQLQPPTATIARYI
ncbi:gluconokinase [Geomicrobium sp. JCM 19039]|uniref:gluconokinase n=1 Tax=Geomicrobium sp. JCM 19039 TaxID=1460636 RepID=UPI00045F3C5E|nr:FGGY-family carbohydrate kinase [Geomicrobium sp. JCM 19039]GAK11704.1 gluconokinase [Geomicrobium sp. JCM 19039]